MKLLSEWLKERVRQFRAKWKAYPVKTQRRCVLYGFLLYLIITVTMLLRMSWTPGKAGHSPGIRHIQNPFIPAGSSSGRMKDSLSNIPKK